MTAGNKSSRLWPWFSLPKLSSAEQQLCPSTPPGPYHTALCKALQHANTFNSCDWRQSCLLHHPAWEDPNSCLFASFHWLCMFLARWKFYFLSVWTHHKSCKNVNRDSDSSNSGWGVINTLLASLFFSVVCMTSCPTSPSGSSSSCIRWAENCPRTAQGLVIICCFVLCACGDVWTGALHTHLYMCLVAIFFLWLCEQVTQVLLLSFSQSRAETAKGSGPSLG